MKHLVIIGAGGFAREVCWHAKNSLGFGDAFELKGFLDGDVCLDDSEYHKLPFPLLGNVKNYNIQEDDVFVCAIANPSAREKLTGIIEKKGGDFINLIHKTAVVSLEGIIGNGCIITLFCIIPPDYTIGNHLIMNSKSGLAHDVKIGDFCSMMAESGMMGNVRAGNRVYMAHDAHALPHSVLEDDAYVGEGSVVFKRVKRGQRVFGNPALPM